MKSAVKGFVWLVLGSTLIPNVSAQDGRAELRTPKVEILGIEPRKPATEVTEDPAAGPASVTVITKRDLDRKSVTTYGDIFRGVAGVNVLEYGQGLVAYGISMRGFDEGHGRNVAVFLDGMPLNVTGSQHTNGYMDLAQLIPELISRADLTRGPFSILAGNHAVGGSIQLYTDANPQSGLKLTIDSFGRARAVPILNTEAGPGTLLVAFDLTKGSGYAKQSDISRANLFTRYSMPIGAGVAALRFQAYTAEADAPGWLNYDKLKSGQIPPREFLNFGIGDAKDQQNLVFNYKSDDAEGATGWASGWFASVYFNNDIRKRWTNFDLTLPLESSANLNQERDRLQQLGFDVRKVTSFQSLGLPSQLLAGVQINREDIEAKNFVTGSGRNEIGPTSVNRNVVTATTALYAQYQVQPIARLKVTAGARYDRLNFDVGLKPDDTTFGAAMAAALPTSVSQTEGQFSPKLGAALALMQRQDFTVELFGNAARGLKSPYPFADYYANTGASGVVPSLAISRLDSLEAGLQGGRPDGSATWRGSMWNTKQQQEADRNAVGIFQNFKETERDGFDVEGSLLISESVRVFGNYSQVRARIVNPVTAGFDRIPNVPEYLGTIGVLGITDIGAHRLDWTLANTLVGPQAITTDNTRRTESLNRTTGRLAYSNAGWNGISTFVTATYYDKQLEELVFDFGGGLSGTSVKPRWKLLVGVQIPFGAQTK